MFVNALPFFSTIGLNSSFALKLAQKLLTSSGNYGIIHGHQTMEAHSQLNREQLLQFCRGQKEHRGQERDRGAWNVVCACAARRARARACVEMNTQARDSTRWMPRRCRPMKDAETGET